MTHEEKIIYMQIAGNLCTFHFKTADLDLLVSLYELIIEKEGNADMMEVAKIKASVHERNKQKPVIIPNEETHT